MKSYKQRIRLFWSILLLIGNTFLSSAQETLILTKNDEEVSISNKYLEIFEDTKNQFNIEDVSNPSFKGRFKVNPDTGTFAYIINPKSAYWVRMRIKTNEILNKRFVFENLDEHIEHFAFYKPLSNNKYEELKTGFVLPFKKREYQHKNFIFDIDPDTSTRTFYVRVASNNKNPILFRVKSEKRLVEYSNNEYILLGIYYGILAIMAIYNFLIFMSLREKVYLYYLFYVLCCVVISFSEDGLGFQYFWPKHPSWNYYINILAPLVLILSFAIYSKSFLELKKYFPKVNYLINGILVVYILTFLFDTTLFNLKWNSPFFILPFLILYVTSILILKKGYRPARYYIVAYSFMMVGIAFLILRMGYTIIWDSILVVYSFNIGVVFEIVILSFALGDRIKLIKLEKEMAQQNTILQLMENEKLKDKVNRELEEKVTIRTREIKQINLELNEINDSLKEKNEELILKNHELEITYDHVKFQADEINRMNLLLGESNQVLETNVKELVKARVMLKKVDFDEFSKMFPDKETCYKYVADLKWVNGYTCRKCGNTNFCVGTDTTARRCTKCRYNESAIAYTIFKKLKFPINKAFYILFLVYSNGGKISSVQLSQILSLRQSTCWIFSKKLIDCMKERKKVLEQNQSDGWSLLILDDPNKEEE
jgi:hypothetical protein